MKKKYFILMLVVIVVAFIGILIITLYNNTNVFELDSKYYSEGKFIDVTKDEVDSLLENKVEFILYTHNNYCSLKVPCDQIFEIVMSEYKFDILKLAFSDFKESKLYDDVKFAPTIIIVKDGEVIDYLDANSDIDLDKYQDANKFKDWLDNYVVLEKNK